MFRSEILAPAGDLFKLKTAVRYGADAVYLAGPEFGLRSAARNFSLPEIREGIAYAHRHQAQVYIVLNGFLFDEDLNRLPSFLAELEGFKPDAFIVSDLGVIRTVRHHSTVPVHLSTQASALNTHSARFWASEGVTRIVLGREASIDEAARMKQEAGCEVEMFIHGAMCMAYSGNCTISNYTAGRDSNRGGCVQSCRFHYQSEQLSGHFLSSKDLMGLQHLPRFLEREIDSLKIEGRMKSPLYVATTVRAYAAARDQLLANPSIPVIPDFRHHLAELDSMSHRDYTDASLLRPAGQDSIYNHEEGYAPHSHDLAGHVVARVAGDYLAIELKNPLAAGETLEVLAPNGRNLVLDTTQMRSVTGERISRFNPNQVVLLDDHPDADVDLICRKPRLSHVRHNPPLSA